MTTIVGTPSGVNPHGPVGCAWLDPAEKKIKRTQRKLDRVLFNIEIWGLGWQNLVDVCRV